MVNRMANNNSDSSADTIEKRFDNLYPDYDYSLESSYSEKDARKRKRIKQ